MNKFYIQVDRRSRTHYIKKMYISHSGYQISFTTDMNEAKAFTQDQIDVLKARNIFENIHQIPKEGD